MSFQGIHRCEGVLVGHVIADKDRHSSHDRRFAHEGMNCRSLIDVQRLDLAHHLTMNDPKVPGGRMDQILDLVPNPFCLVWGFSVMDGQRTTLIFEHDTFPRIRKISQRHAQAFQSLDFP
jgi:hypothetical protein